MKSLQMKSTLCFFSQASISIGKIGIHFTPGMEKIQKQQRRNERCWLLKGAEWQSFPESAGRKTGKIWGDHLQNSFRALSSLLGV